MVAALRLLAVVAAVALSPGAAAAQAAWAPEAELELVIDPLPEPPFAGEMILATLRGRYIGNVAREDLELPVIDDFSWLQLGDPAWSDQRIANRATKVFEQRLAFFPQRDGRLTIAPMSHHLTFVGHGARVETVATSAPVTIEVRPRPDIGKAWWLPARAVTVLDEWQPPPDALGEDEWARRTVTLEVAGLPPQALPPPPPMYAGGLFTFSDPEERSIRLTPDGPVSTIVWRYRMQPQSAAPADLDDIPVSWFDTEARVGRSFLLEGREIAFATSALPREPGPLARVAMPAGALAGGALGLALLLPGLGLGRSQAVGRCGRALAFALDAGRLRRAEFTGDARAARTVLLRLLRARGADPAASPSLVKIDRCLFGPDPCNARCILRGLTWAAIAEVRAPVG